MDTNGESSRILDDNKVGSKYIHQVNETQIIFL